MTEEKGRTEYREFQALPENKITIYVITILFTRICVSQTFARYSRKGSLNIAQLSVHTLTPSWNHYYGQCSTEDSNEDGYLTGCTKEAPLVVFLDHHQP